MMAWERQRRLQDKYNYLLELEKVKNFSWEDWRKRVSSRLNPVDLIGLVADFGTYVCVMKYVLFYSS